MAKRMEANEQKLSGEKKDKDKKVLMVRWGSRQMLELVESMGMRVGVR